jgi:hypothetical protein
MDVCARLCAHYLTHDEVDDVSFVDGNPVFPDTAVVPGHSPQKTRHIIIYQEFSSMVLLLRDVSISTLISFVSDVIYLDSNPLWGEEHFNQRQDSYTKEGQVDKGVP